MGVRQKRETDFSFLGSLPNPWQGVLLHLSVWKSRRALPEVVCKKETVTPQKLQCAVVDRQLRDIREHTEEAAHKRRKLLSGFKTTEAYITVASFECQFIESGSCPGSCVFVLWTCTCSTHQNSGNFTPLIRPMS
jgi:hypothetical protein